MLRITLRLVLLGVLSLPVLPAFAEGGDAAEAPAAAAPAAAGAGSIYKCKDEKGTVVYSQKPCDAKAEAMQDLPAVNEQEAVSTTTDDSNAAGKKAGQKFECDGRTRCSEMTSCSEARFFLENCPDVEMDSGNNGAPCESEWCGV